MRTARTAMTTRALVAGVWAMLLAGQEAARAQPARPCLVYSDAATSSLPRVRQWDGSSVAWGAPGAASSVAGAPAWQVAELNPVADRVALLSLSTGRRLELQYLAAGSWSAPVVVTTDTGTSGKRVFGVASEQLTGHVLVAYRKYKNKSLYYRVYDGLGGSVMGEQTLALALNNAPNYITLAPKPHSNEVLLLIDTDTHLYASVWNGSAFVSTTTLETSAATSGRPCAAAYTSQSKTALVTWGSGANVGKYATWNGSAWSAPALMPATGGSKPQWVVMSANPNAASNEVLWAAICANKRVYANRWNGAAWGASSTVEAACPTSSQHQVEIAHTPDGTKALLVWTKVGTFDLMYQTWDVASLTWGPATHGPNIGSSVRAMQMGRGDYPNMVHVVALRQSSAALITDYTLYSDSGTVTVGTADVSGDVGQNVAGINLPAKPPHGSNTAGVTVPAGATQSLAPGVYGNLVVNDGATLNLTGGSYIFRRVTLGTGASITCDTSAANTIIAVDRSGFTIGDSSSIQRLDTNDPNDVEVHVCSGNAVFGHDCTLDASKFYVYSGAVTFGNNAAIVSLVASIGNITLTTGNVDPSDEQTAGGQLIGTDWTAGSPGATLSLSNKVTGSGSTECFHLGIPRFVLYISRWAEVGQDE